MSSQGATWGLCIASRGLSGTSGLLEDVMTTTGSWQDIAKQSDNTLSH